MLIPTYPPKEGYGNLRWRGGGVFVKNHNTSKYKAKWKFPGGYEEVLKIHVNVNESKKMTALVFIFPGINIE